MAKKLKEGTLEKIRHIIEEEGGTEKLTKKQLKKHHSFVSMQKGYMNAYEKGIIDSILNMIYDGKTNDEIQLILGEVSDIKEEVVKKTEKESEEIEAETEAMFVNSTGQVVDGPIVVQVGTDSSMENKKDDSIYMNTTRTVIDEASDNVERHPVTGQIINVKPNSGLFKFIINPELGLTLMI
jgi:hypothetical protein